MIKCDTRQNDTCCYAECCYNDCHYSECWILFLKWLTLISLSLCQILLCWVGIMVLFCSLTHSFGAVFILNLSKLLYSTVTLYSYMISVLDCNNTHYQVSFCRVFHFIIFMPSVFLLNVDRLKVTVSTKLSKSIENNIFSFLSGNKTELIIIVTVIYNCN